MTKTQFIEKYYEIEVNGDITDRQFKQLIYSEIELKKYVSKGWRNIFVPNFLFAELGYYSITDIKKLNYIDLEDLFILDEVTSICDLVTIENDVAIRNFSFDLSTIAKLKHISNPKLQEAINLSIVIPRNYMDLLTLDLSNTLPNYIKEYFYQSIMYGYDKTNKTNIFKFLFNNKDKLSSSTKQLIYEYTAPRTDMQIISNLITDRYDYPFTTLIPERIEEVIYIPSTFDTIISKTPKHRQLDYFSKIKNLKQIENKEMFDIVFETSSIKTDTKSFEETPEIWKWIDDNQMVEILSLSEIPKEISKLAKYVENELGVFAVSSVYLDICTLMTKHIVIQTEEQLNVLKQNDYIFWDNNQAYLSPNLLDEFIRKDKYRDEVKHTLMNYAKNGILHLIWDVLYDNKDLIDLSFIVVMNFNNTSFVEEFVLYSLGLIAKMNIVHNNHKFHGKTPYQIEQFLYLLETRNQKNGMIFLIEDKKNRDVLFQSEKIINFYLENHELKKESAVTAISWLVHNFEVYNDFDNFTKKLISKLFSEFFDEFKKIQLFFKDANNKVVSDLYYRMTLEEKMKVIDTLEEFNIIDLI